MTKWPLNNTKCTKCNHNKLKQKRKQTQTIFSYQLFFFALVHKFILTNKEKKIKI